MEQSTELSLKQWYEALPIEKKAEVQTRFIHVFGKGWRTFYRKINSDVKLWKQEENFFNEQKQLIAA